MRAHKSTREGPPGRLFPDLLFATLGTVAVIAAIFLVRSFRPIEPILLLIPVGFGAVGFRQNLVRGVLSALIIYIATGVAAMLHLTIAPFVGAFFGNVITNSIRALSFAVLTIQFCIALEAISRYLMPDTDLPGLGILDNLGSFVIYLAIGVMVASITFNTIGYSGRWKRAHDAALLRTTFNRVFSLHYRAQSFWLPGGPPRIYTYDLE